MLARVGANDRTVHPYFVRRAVRLLKESEVDVTYTELPNLEHWWWDTKLVLFVGTVIVLFAGTVR